MLPRAECGGRPGSPASGSVKGTCQGAPLARLALLPLSVGLSPGGWEGCSDGGFRVEASAGVKAAADGSGGGPPAVGTIREGEIVVIKGGHCACNCGTVKAVLTDGRCVVVVLPDYEKAGEQITVEASELVIAKRSSGARRRGRARRRSLA